MTIKGIKLFIEDSGTGAQALFHQIAFDSVDPRSQQTTVHISGYVSEAKQIEGRHPLMQNSVTLSGNPTRAGDTLDWIYTELVKPVPSTTQPELVAGMLLPPALDSQNIYAGGELLYEMTDVSGKPDLKA